MKKVTFCFSLAIFGHKLRSWRGTQDAPLSPKKQKFKDAFDKYGVAGVSLLGQTLLPSQITALAMVTLGAHKSAVIFWQTIAIIILGIVFGVLAVQGFNMLEGR